MSFSSSRCRASCVASVVPVLPRVIQSVRNFFCLLQTLQGSGYRNLKLQTKECEKQNQLSLPNTVISTLCFFVRVALSISNDGETHQKSNKIVVAVASAHCCYY